MFGRKKKEELNKSKEMMLFTLNKNDTDEARLFNVMKAMGFVVTQNLYETSFSNGIKVVKIYRELDSGTIDDKTTSN